MKLWNLEKFLSVNNIMGTARYYVGDKKASDLSGMNIRLTNNGWEGMCATIVNAVSKYHTQAAQLGIGVPPKVHFAAIWGKKFSAGDGSAPMFNLLKDPVPQTTYFTNFLQNLLSFTNDHLIPFMSLVPDIIIPETAGFSYEDLTGTVLHEFTHAAHANKVGKGFWSKVILGELSGSAIHKHPHSKRGALNATSIALAEAWAYDVENLMMHKLFGNPDRYINQRLENWYNPNNKNSVGDWIPRGIFFDLYDVNEQYRDNDNRIIGEGNITDNVSGISYSALFANFAANDDMNLYKIRLMQKYPSKAESIGELFAEYSF